MNVLILTPDAVGSTLLQRLITIYMQFHEFDRPVINLHELTNGLEKYYSPDFDREIVSKRRVTDWRYYQTLEEIVGILSSVDHYKTSRLAHYHIRNRQDPISQQIPFYRYLDDNFFVIACQRQNIFEHALSMSMSKVTKKLNVYNHREKIESFIDIYINKIDLDIKVFEYQLDAYQDYLDWSRQYFNIASFFQYEKHMPDIEKYILNLPIFSGSRRTITWREKFGLEFNDWNRCHRIPSDIGYVALCHGSALIDLLDQPTQSHKQDLVREYQQLALPEWPAINNGEDYERLPQEIKSQFLQMRDPDLAGYLPASQKDFYNAHIEKFKTANAAIDRMRELDIIVSAPPIKKQNLIEKLHMIKNWRQCLEIYNNWITQRPLVGNTLCEQDLCDQMSQELEFWYLTNQSEAVTDAQRHEQLIYQNGARP